MLAKAAKEDIAQYMDFAYSLAMDPAKSGYPLWADGISTKEDFVEHVWRSYHNENREILLFVSDGAVEGWIQFFYIEEDRYLQTNGFLIHRNTEQALAEFLEYASARFAGYDLYLGFPKENAHAISFLQKSGCKLIEESYHDIFVFENAAIQCELDGIVRVTEDNFSEFERIHQTDSETYWNSERIFATLNEWMIYLLYREEVAEGYICAKDGEIFSLGYLNGIFDKSVYKALVSVILKNLETAGYKHLTFFNSEESQSTALDLGFSCVGEYVLYLKSASD